MVFTGRSNFAKLLFMSIALASLGACGQLGFLKDSKSKDSKKDETAKNPDGNADSKGQVPAPQPETAAENKPVDIKPAEPASNTADQHAQNPATNPVGQPAVVSTETTTNPSTTTTTASTGLKSQDIQGTWASPCQSDDGFSGKAFYTITNTSVEIKEVYYVGANCDESKKDTTSVITGTFTLGSASTSVTGATEVDFSYSKLSQTPHSADALEFMNDDGDGNKLDPNWKVGEAKEEQIQFQQFTHVKLVNGKLQIAEPTEAKDGSSAAKRASTFSSEEFSKVQ